MTMNVALNNGVQMPALGYRLIDTVAAYDNEREVGQAIDHSGLARDEVFIETKIWISDYGYDQTLHGFDKSAGKLGVDRIDLLILHQALPTRFDLTREAYPRWRPCSPTGGYGRSASATSCPGTWTPYWSRLWWCPRSTRSRCTRTSPSRP